MKYGVGFRTLWIAGLAGWLVSSGAGAGTIYVTPTGSGSGASWATPTSLTNALAIAVSNDLVLVSNGVYLVTNACTIDKAVEIRGVASRSDTVIARNPAGDTRLFDLSHASAVVSALTISNGYTKGDGAGFYMTAGTISNVVVTHCNAYNNWNSAGGIYMTGGTVADSEIKYCDGGAVWSSYIGGSAIGMKGGEVRNVTMHHNGLQSSSYKGTVAISGGSLRSCVVTNNQGISTAGILLYGSGLLENCLIAGNTATDASGGVGGLRMSGGQSIHVTVADNTAPANAVAGGVYVTGGTIKNSIAWGNLRGLSANNMAGGDAYARYTAASELAVTNGNKNSDPLFTTVGGVPYHLSARSPCVDAGTNLAGIAFDLNGTNRVIDGNGDAVAVPDMGCYEAPEMAPGTLYVSIEALSAVAGLAPLDVVLKASPVGNNTTITRYSWDLDGDGTPELTGGGLGRITNTFMPGAYTVRLWVTNSMDTGASAICSNLVNVVGSNIYVSVNGTHERPYHTLAKAATNLQAALDIALAGCAVVVDAGVYGLTNHYRFAMPLTVRGIGARADTIIAGTGSGSVRPFWLDHDGGMVHSLTVSNWVNNQYGNTFYMTAGTVSNVVVTHCGDGGSGWNYGGGAYLTGGLLVDSVIKHCNNKGYYEYGGSAIYMTGGEVRDVTMHDNGFATDSYKGTVHITGGALRRCRVINNRGYGTAGIYARGSALIENCLVVSNTDTRIDAGVGVGGIRLEAGRMVHVTVADNTAPTNGAAAGVYRTGGVVTNSIMWGNMLGAVAGGYSGDVSAVAYSCAPELTAGIRGNITGNPVFKGDGDYHLRRASPCIDTGLDFPSIPVDLAGNPRILAGFTDMGAYETVPPKGWYLVFQ